MPGDISRSYKGPKTGDVPSWMDDPSPSTMAQNEQFAAMVRKRCGLLCAYPECSCRPFGDGGASSPLSSKDSK